MKRIKNLISHNHEEVIRIISNPENPSTYEDFDDFKLLVLRRLTIEEKSMNFYSEVFLITAVKIHHFNKDKDAFEQLEGGEVKLASLLKSFYVNNKKILDSYSNETERLENSLFERSIPRHFMDVWFDLKKDISKFENFYQRNLLVFSEFQKKIKFNNPKVVNLIADIGDTIKFQTSTVSSLQSRLDALHHYYNSIKNDRMNKSIYVLTVVSAVFLPLNLIVGFFGMNTEGLFFKDNPMGTMNVVFLLAGIMLLSLIGLRIFKMLDKYFLKFVLGRYNFYKGIKDRLNDL